MGDVACAVLSGQRQGDALGSDRRVALARRREQRLQGLVDPRIARDEPPTGHGKRIAGGENEMAGRIGMHDTPGRIEQADPGAEAVERICEGRGLC